jgi:serine/threonine protein kinase
MKEDSIFFDALNITSPQDLAAFLDRACAGDAELRHNVEKLLEAHEKAGQFMQAGAVLGTTVDESSADVAGENIGPYKLLELIGEGGMGTVWMAEQHEPIRRRVAIKLIKPGMDYAQFLARFEAERHALALMDHPNIAKVLDAGMVGARPYFVMELVKGIPITQYCDDKRLTPHDRLTLFLDVCKAVQHAHQKGVIHRDLKPSNVLVAPFDGKPIVKIIDFGVAKATGRPLTEKTLFTAFGAVVGTPEYMSPEQAELNNQDIDTRSDIYSLGVLLYELLTGSTPLQRNRLKEAGVLELLRVIREEEPEKPSTRLSSTEELPSVAANRGLEPKKLNGIVRGDLDWIVMKCLEKDRDRRYETANALATDMQRYLADEPVLACPPSMSYRVRKFVRRNKVPVVAAALILLALVAGTAGTTWGMVSAKRSKRDAVNAAEGMRTAKEEAESRDAQKEAVLNFIDNKILTAPRPKGYGLGRDVSLRKAVEQALPYLDEEFASMPTVEARLRLTLARSFEQLGDPKVACEQAQRALELNTKHLGPEHPSTLASMLRLASTYLALGRFTESLKLNEETLALRKAKLGPEHPDTLLSMLNLANSYWALGRGVEALKLREETLPLLKAKFGPAHLSTLKGMNNLAVSLMESGQRARAQTLFEETLRLQNAELGPEHPETVRTLQNLATLYGDADPRTVTIREKSLAWQKTNLGPEHPSTLESMRNLSNTYSDLGRHAEALRVRQEALALSKAKLGPDHPDTLNSMHLLAQGYDDLGLHSEALKLREEIWALEKAKLGPVAPKTLRTRICLAVSMYELGRYGEGLKLCEEALPLLTAKLGPNDPDVLMGITALAACYVELGRYAEALKIYEETLPLAKAKLGPDHQDTLKFMNNIASCCDALGRYPEALKLHEETLALRKAKLGPDHPDTLTSMNALAQVYANVGRQADALKLREEALALRRVKLGPDHPDTFESMSEVAISYDEVGRYAEALKLKEETLALRIAKLGPDNPNTLHSKHNLACSYITLGRHVDALKLCDEVLEKWRARLGATHPNTLRAMQNLAEAYRALGRRAEALKLAEETLALRKAKLGPDHPDTLLSMVDVARSYWALGRHAEALKLQEEALAECRAKLGAQHRNSAIAMNDLASMLVYCPESKLRDPRRSAELSKEAVGLEPAHPSIWATRGAALYRVADYGAATAALQKSIELSSGGRASAFLFLAMSQHQLGHKTEARSWYDKGVKWMEKNAPQDEDLGRIRVEAAELLGIKDDAATKPELIPLPREIATKK